MTFVEAPARAGFAAISRHKVYQEVARQLERHILEQLKPGDLLPPERQLGELLGVSRGSVRDAIRSLELKGLLEPRQGFGTVVCEPVGMTGDPLAKALVDKRQLVTELIEVRKMIEPHVAACAARRAGRDDLADMQEILERQETKVSRGEPGAEEDAEFHYAIALASRNRVIVKVVEVLMDLLRETREKSLQGKGRPQKSLAGHCRILAALKRHDAVAVQAAVHRHLQEIENIAVNKL